MIHIMQHERRTMGTNMEWIPSLWRNVLAMSGAGDLEATATWIPFPFNAPNIPLACGYRYGISSS